MADDFTRSIEDNYPEYVLETFGYQYDALEVIDREALTRHDNLRHASREELERAMGDGEGVERDALAALAIAHRWRELEALEESAEALEFILSAPPHASVAIDEVFEFAILTRLTLKQYDRARHLLDAPPEWTESWHRLPLLSGLVATLEGDPSDGERMFDAYIDDEGAEGERGERCYETAELLSDYLEHELAKTWLVRARSRAEAEADRALLVDITLMEDKLERLQPKDLGEEE